MRKTGGNGRILPRFAGFVLSVPASLLPELEDVVQHGSAEKRAETLRRITTLFLDGAPGFHAEHIALFDDVIGCLIEEIEAKALAELARRIAPVANAPVGVISRLAKNDDIAVAGPVLKQGRLPIVTLCTSPKTKARRICWRCRHVSASARRSPTFLWRAATARSRGRSPITATRNCRIMHSRPW